MVEGQNYSFSAASKGYKRYQTMNKGLILNDMGVSEFNLKVN